jgi:PAS domain S-box-containing protein
VSTETDTHSVDDCSPARVLGRVDEAVYALDDEWQFTFINERAASLLNRTPGELLGNKIWNAIPGLEETIVGERLREAMATQTSVRFENYDEKAERRVTFRIYPAEDGATVCFSDVTGARGKKSEQEIPGNSPSGEQKRREEAFGQSAAFLKRTQEIATVGGYEVNLETGSVQWTDEVYRIHDLPADETITLEEGVNFYHPADRPKIETAIERLTTDGESYDLELRIVTADDRLRWVRTIGDPQFDDDENVVGIVGVFQDITENKRLENSLRDSERSLRKLTSIASDTDRGFESKLASLLELGVDRLDIPYGFLTRIEGDTQHIVRAVGDHSQLQTGASVPQSESYCRETIQQEEPLVINDAVAEGWKTDAAYQRFDFDCYIGGTITVSGELYGTLCFADTRRREHEFGDAERAFVKLLVQWISHELTTTSFETKLRELNETAKRLMSATSKSQVASIAIESARSILNMPIAGVWWHDDDTDALVPECMTEQAGEYIGEQPTFEDGAALAWDAFTTGETQVYDDLRTVSGIYNEETVLRSEVIIPLGDYGIMTTGSTDQRAFSKTDLKLLEVLSSTVEAALGRAEREMVLRQTQADLEQSNEELEQFAYAASHDLQEPLRTISSYLTLLERRYGDELDDDAAEFIEFAVDGADRMRSMIQALLAYSRVDTHGESFEAVDVSALFERVVDDLELKIAETDATVSTPTTETTVVGDRNQLAQLFQNLIENGIKYNTTNPEITVSVAHRDEMVVFEVTDDGIGMEADQIDEVFEVFHRLHTREEFAGTGIGLSICRKIVGRHGGTIGVDSEPGEGSTFTLTLPSGEPSDG